MGVPLSIARDFNVNGECLVRVKGGAHWFPGPIYRVSELGLAVDNVEVTFKGNYQDIYVDDFGPNVPAEVLWNMSEASIKMKLIHYNPQILEMCVIESMGGASGIGLGIINPLVGIGGGTMTTAGKPFGSYLPIFASGNHYISLTLESPQLEIPWRFPASYLDGQPLMMPLGTTASSVELNWRAIPYTFPLKSFVSTSPGNAGQSFDGSYLPFIPSGQIEDGSSVSYTGELTSLGAILYDHQLDSEN